MKRIKQQLKNVWKFRSFVITAVYNEFRTRFARSGLGMAWMVLNPLAQVVVYAFVLSQVMKAKLGGIGSEYAYPIYLLAGLVMWNFFVEIVGRLTGIFVDNGHLLKKMAFPKLILPTVAVGSSLVSYMVLLFSMLIIFALLGHTPGWSALFWLPVLTLVLLVFSVGFGLLLGILNVFVRDTGQVMGIVMQFWFWLTPIVYVADVLPDQYRWILLLNPLTPVAEGFHAVLVYGVSPAIWPLCYPFLLAVLFLSMAGILLFKGGEEMTDVL